MVVAYQKPQPPTSCFNHLSHLAERASASGSAAVLILKSQPESSLPAAVFIVAKALEILNKLVGCSEV